MRYNIKYNTPGYSGVSSYLVNRDEGFGAIARSESRVAPARKRGGVG